MTDLWYQNPAILLNNVDQFFPNKSLNRIEKINSLARFAIYYSILILIFKQDTKWFSIAILIILISLFLGTTEKFTSTDKTINSTCTKPSKTNPFMNYTVGDLIENKDRDPACNYEDVKDEMRKEFRSHVYADSSDMWGKYYSDREFYTMPNTDIVNNQTGFALALYGKSGECKTTGNNCLKISDVQFHAARIQSANETTNG